MRIGPLSVYSGYLVGCRLVIFGYRLLVLRTWQVQFRLVRNCRWRVVKLVLMALWAMMAQKRVALLLVPGCRI